MEAFLVYLHANELTMILTNKVGYIIRTIYEFQEGCNACISKDLAENPQNIEELGNLCEREKKMLFMSIFINVKNFL